MDADVLEALRQRCTGLADTDHAHDVVMKH